MSEAKQRIQGLMAKGAVSHDDGEKLLAALERSPKPTSSGWSLLVDPFERFGGNVAALCGVATAMASVWISSLGRIRYDGLLDLHTTERPTRLSVCAIDQLAAFVLPAAIAWACIRAWGQRARVVDVLGAVGLSRVPYALVGLLLSLAPLSKGKLGPLDWLLLSVTFGGLGWCVGLLYFGLRSASGLAGKRMLFAFLTFVVLSEVASKVIVGLVSP